MSRDRPDPVVRPVFRANARRMRREPTEAETKLWRLLRSRRLADRKFRRQVPLGSYIVDFLCFEARLVVEADGGQHGENQAHVARDKWLAANRFRVARYWNSEILGNLEGVLADLVRRLSAVGVEIQATS